MTLHAIKAQMEFNKISGKIYHWEDDYPALLVIRTRPKHYEALKSLEGLKPMGCIFLYKYDLGWFECLFEKVQIVGKQFRKVKK